MTSEKNTDNWKNNGFPVQQYVQRNFCCWSSFPSLYSLGSKIVDNSV